MCVYRVNLHFKGYEQEIWLKFGVGIFGICLIINLIVVFANVRCLILIVLRGPQLRQSFTCHRAVCH